MSLAARGADLLGASLERSSVLAGGDLSDVLEIVLADGRVAVVKDSPAPAVEAAMLDALAAKAVPAPAVLAHDDRALVLERLPTGGQIGGCWRDLGAVLARLHAVTQPDAAQEQALSGGAGRYGWSDDYAFAAVAIENAWADDWPVFFAERRLLNQLAYLPKSLASRVETLARTLGDRLPRRPDSSLLHGDLWTGNVLVIDARVSGLIDPACYYGDREVDLAMLTLFGHPGPDFDDAYGPLPSGYESRRPIYQLWPALVHYRLFGAGYGAMVERMLSSAGV